MSNRLKPVQVDAIRLLWERGWSRRRIARELGVNRETVNRYVHQWTTSAANADPPGTCDSNQAKLHIGSTVEATNPANVHIGSAEAPAAAIHAESNPANVQVGSEGRLSSCWVYRALIQGKLDQGLTAQRIFQDLQSEQSFAGCYHSVLRFVRRLQPRQPLPFRRMEVGPGDEVQVDFNQGAWIVDGEGKKRRPHLFRMVLSHSARIPELLPNLEKGCTTALVR